MTQEHKSTRPIRLVRRPELKTVYGISWGNTRLWQLCKEGRFPKPIKLMEGGRAIAWVASEVEEWIAARVNARDEAEAEGAAAE